MASYPGGVRFTGYVSPSDTSDVYAVTWEEFNKGGYRTVVDITARDAITAPRRIEGMLVRVLSDNKIYTLSGGVDNANWVVATFDGSSFTEVNAYADLPDPTTVPGQTYIVLTSTGVWPFNRHPAGMYRSDGVAWTYLSVYPDLVKDANFGIQNSVDNSKAMKLNAGNITTGQTRTLTMADRDYDLDKPMVTYEDVITGLPNPAYAEGRVFYDNTKKALSYYNDEAEVTVTLGQEMLIPVWNNSGATITNGSAVYPIGIFNGLPTIGLATAHDKEKCRLVGVVTHDIENNSKGYVTKAGNVGDLDTSGYVDSDIIYLSETPGLLTNAKPTGASYITRIGKVGVIDAVNGSIVVDINTTEFSVEASSVVGWSPSDTATIGWDDGTRTLTLSPTGTDFCFYQFGDKYSKLTDSIVLPNEEGMFVIYYNMGTLAYVKRPTDGQISSIIRNNPVVAYVYWNATNSRAEYIGNELHEIGMSADTHNWAHFSLGARYLNGILPTDVIADASGALNSHAQFGISAGAIADEDIYHTTPAYVSTTGLRVAYLEGPEATPYLRFGTNAGFSFLNTGTGRVAYNSIVGGVWQVLESSNFDFVCCHVLAINENTSNRRVIALMGQNNYLTLAAAQEGAAIELKTVIRAGILPQETVKVATFILQTADSYANAVNARIISISAEEDWIDWTEAGTGNPGSTTVTTSYSDADFEIYDDGDITKKMKFQLSGFTTGNTRTISVPDTNGTVALATGAPGGQNIIGGTATTQNLLLRSNTADDGEVRLIGNWSNYDVGETNPIVYFNGLTGVRYIGDGTYDIVGSPLVLNDSILNLGCSKSAYGQVNLFNASNDATASGDYVVTADNGTDTTHYIDMGINSSGWLGTGLGEGANKAYIYSPDDAIDIFTGDRVDVTLGYDSVERVRVSQNAVRIHGAKEAIYDSNGVESDLAGQMGTKVCSRTSGTNTFGVAQFATTTQSGVGFFVENQAAKDIILADISCIALSTVGGLEESELYFKTMSSGSARVERVRINASRMITQNEFVVGAIVTPPISALNGRGVQVWKNAPAESLVFTHNATATPEAGIRLGHSGGAIGAPATTASGQGGAVGLVGHDGTNYVSDNKAAILMTASSGWTPTSTPTRIDFATTLSGATTRATRATIFDTGRMAINRTANTTTQLWVEATASGINESIQKWSVSDDAGGFLEARNGLASTSASRFNPCLYGLSTNTSDPCLTLWGGLPGQTGTTPAVLIKADYNGAATTSRPVLAVNNHTTRLINVLFDGTFEITGDTLRMSTQRTPASAGAAGTKGDICHDTNYIYVCTATNTWKRAALATW